MDVVSPVSIGRGTSIVPVTRSCLILGVPGRLKVPIAAPGSDLDVDRVALLGAVDTGVSCTTMTLGIVLAERRSAKAEVRSPDPTAG